MFCSFFAQIKFDVSDRELVIPLSDGQHDHEDEGYSHEVVQRILAAKDEGLVSDKAYHELRMAFPESVRSHVPPLSTILQERRTQNKEITFVTSRHHGMYLSQTMSSQDGRSGKNPFQRK